MQAIFTIALLICLGASALAETAASAPKAVTAHDRKEAEKVFLRGAKSYRDRAYEKAEDEFLLALKTNPNKGEYAMALAMAQEHRITELVQQSAQQRSLNHTLQADALMAKAREIDPENPLVQQHAPATGGFANAVLPVRTSRLAGAIDLQPGTKKQSFHIKGNTRDILLQVAQAYNIRMQFEVDVQSKPARLDLEDVDYATAIDVATEMAHVFLAPLDPHYVLAANDTIVNHDRLDRMEEETIYLPGLSSEQLNDLGNVLRQVFEVKQTTTQPLAGSIVIRAPATSIDVINQTLEGLIGGENEVVVRVQLYSVVKDKTRGTGLTLPQTINVLSVASLAQQIIRDNQAIVQQLIASGLLPANASQTAILGALLASGLVTNSAFTGRIVTFGGGLTTALVSAGNFPVLQNSLTSSDSRELDDVHFRVLDGQNVNFRAGTRYPIVQSTYSTGISSAVGSQLSNINVNGTNLGSLLGSLLGNKSSSSVIPQVQFEDLGLTVKSTPRVGRNGDIALHLEMKIESLTGTALNDIPVLANRFISSDFTVKNGDTAVVVSDLNQQESVAVDGTPGLSELPGFQWLTGRTGDKQEANLVLLVTPTLIRRGVRPMKGPYIPFTPRPTE